MLPSRILPGLTPAHLENSLSTLPLATKSIDFLAFFDILLHEADSAALLLFHVPYEADSAAILPFMLLYEADSDAMLRYFLPYEADHASVLFL